MIERFLRYSIERGRKIKVMRQTEDGSIKHENLTALSVADGKLVYLTSRKKTAQEMPLSSILAASYARGDEGDTLVNEGREGTV